MKRSIQGIDHNTVVVYTELDDNGVVIYLEGALSPKRAQEDVYKRRGGHSPKAACRLELDEWPGFVEPTSNPARDAGITPKRSQI